MKTKIFNKSILRGFLVASVVTLCAGKSFSQETQKQDTNSEVSIAIGGIFSSLDYDLAQGEVNQGKGMNIGLRYAYYLNNTWSLGIGAGYQTYKGLASLGEAQGAYPATDFEGEDFEFRYTAQNYREEQKISSLDIPLTIQYETQGQYTRVYFMAGAKISLPLKSDYRVRATSLSTSGYYSQYNVELFDPAFAGFGEYGAQESSEKELDTDMGYALLAEIGLKQKVGEKSAIYIGAYLDYGLNSILEGENEKQLVEYDTHNPNRFKYNSIFSSGYAKEMKMISYGIKIRYALGF